MQASGGTGFEEHADGALKYEAPSALFSLLRRICCPAGSSRAHTTR